MFGSFTKVANGNIEPCRFVKLDSSGDGLAVRCGAGENMYGISQKEPRVIALSGAITVSGSEYAAIAGEMLNIYGPGDDEAWLELGGTVVAGAYLKSDADGKGVNAGTDKDKVGAQAMQAGTAGKLIKVKPMRFDLAV